MRLIRTASLGALMMTAAACSSSVPVPPETETATLVEAAPPVNRFEGIQLAEANEAVPVYADTSLDPLRSATLSRFTSEKEFLDWLKATREAAERRGVYSWRSMPVAMMAPPAPPPAPGAAESEPAASDAMSSAQEIVVTGSMASAEGENPEITNNQKAGVDEGGIVKQIGNYLVVLQDGRLFVTDLMPGGEAGLKLADRANVYRSDQEDTWYDEMLVAGRTILVTGYSYGENASEFTVLTLGEDGKVTRDATFYISSDDYYSGSNYASRMIDGKLVIHTPIYVEGRGWWDSFDPPEIREWRKEGPEGERQHLRGQPLFRAEDIWMPVQRVLQPVIHTVTVCDISGVTDTSAPACTATAIVGTEEHKFLVTKDAFWLWMSPSWSERDYDVSDEVMDTCEARKSHAPVNEVAPSALVKLPIDGAQPSVMNVRGEPQNQFSMDMDAGTFRAALDWQSANCGAPYDAPAMLTFFDTPLSALTDTLDDAPGGRYVPLPTPGTSDYEARFTEAHLVYGAREGWGSWAPDEDDEPRENGRAIVVPVDNPSWPVTLTVPHDVIRAERAGPYMALTGYRDHKGLSVSLIDLRKDEPSVASSFVMENRYESENRSHAFNSKIGADGAGLIGLPTVQRSEESERWWWWSSSSDLSYLEVDASGELSKAGDLIATRRDPNEQSPTGYECEVSCVDWYGNARPIFTGGRLLALINSELVEGELEDGVVREIRRIDLTAPPE
ncbi:MAG: beta-propeller domain-containing protein [Hyphomonas sp.]